MHSKDRSEADAIRDAAVKSIANSHSSDVHHLDSDDDASNCIVGNTSGPSATVAESRLAIDLPSAGLNMFFSDGGKEEEEDDPSEQLHSSTGRSNPKRELVQYLERKSEVIRIT